MSVTSLGISMTRSDSMYLLASRDNEVAYLVIETEGTHCEIELERAFVEGLRDQLPATLAGLDRWAAETDACVKARKAGQRAVDATARALELAADAERAGDHELAASLRNAAATASGQAKAVDDAVIVFGDAAVEADHATDRLVDLLGKAEITLSRPAEPVGSEVR
jgi:hypothetical protein